MPFSSPRPHDKALFETMHTNLPIYISFILSQMHSHGHFVLEDGKSDAGEPQGLVRGLIKLFCAHVWVAVLS